MNGLQAALQLNRITRTIDPSLALSDAEVRKRYSSEMAAERQRRRRKRLRAERQQEDWVAEAREVIESTRDLLKTIRPPPAIQAPLLVFSGTRSRRKRDWFSLCRREWVISFTDRGWYVISQRCKNIHHTTRDPKGRFAVPKTQPMPANRKGLRYATKGWMVRAAVCRGYAGMETPAIAALCGKHRSTVWRLWQRPDVQSLVRTVQTCRWRLQFGGTGEIRFPVHLYGGER